MGFKFENIALYIFFKPKIDCMVKTQSFNFFFQKHKRWDVEDAILTLNPNLKKKKKTKLITYLQCVGPFVVNYTSSM